MSLTFTQQEHLVPPKAMGEFTMGYNDLLGSSLWLRLMQDFSHCATAPQGEGYYEAVQAGGEKKVMDEILQRKLKPSKCHLGWVYNMVDRVTDFMPRFYMAYLNGGDMLSVAVDDREGARRIYEKALLKYPNDWSILYHAGFHYLWELQNPKRAALLLGRAQENGAPGWVASLSANLYNRAGQAHVAREIVIKALKRPGLDEMSMKRLKYRLQELNEALSGEH